MLRLGAGGAERRGATYGTLVIRSLSGPPGEPKRFHPSTCGAIDPPQDVPLYVRYRNRPSRGTPAPVRASKRPGPLSED